ncbi:phosphatidylglycerophosphatase and protein-tyrosine phosphatase 1 isoform X1 [Octopus bimaculoides]|uniref:Phosphatidylglycerophosphatase and protein-tyrosine phosphatase 1 n=1 Tax=Octopus bimaculoides TaxID=37653 RepID=A0A0L8HZR0_OCTBM|nr:phosphatidylglycerophosphatase and protein-tyrosine phosphatase 1 isoform X1 [Octopus bimaculoides]XP_014768013.1 phosphatidylglycerophosphatase and protein-tyrosine phosphatase 1 isoform X1 [Octopus bimaculoides]XP_014768014.1 phosphatidylglycerophosphatase and protein-tyrosine phosphatase 1 isoform X1 [Octopus bimaculoides]XP_052830984.1 phosphatidylglycerophosphatase and protein-tyrosine phosphatase 1 isoform X1 [Octopus bimaculoides]|eukprot:XP_014768011.1 PREDICTED: phosphatidylglycerophosphatase and protein-tyrosine phosphatase 1-like isoform X1 [Octopus bimaculoides]
MDQFSAIGTSILNKVAFYPSLFYNYALYLASFRHWYVRIDNSIIFGALPFRQMATQLVEKENVRGVLSANENFETKHFTPSKEEWKDLGVGFLQVEVEDFVGTPSLWQVTQALAFISYYQQLGQCVYVHCKAGRTRSAIIVACYLMMKNQWDDATAWNHILSRCTHVRLTQQQQQFLHFFYLTQTSM